MNKTTDTEGRIAGKSGFIIKYPANVAMNDPQRWFICDAKGRILSKGTRGLPMHDCIALVLSRRLRRYARVTTSGAVIYRLEVTA
jgi:hypothetical protein